MAPTTTGTGPDQVSQTPLVLGPVTFRRFECPSEIAGLGAGEQTLVKHDLPGGTRVVQKFGAFPDEVSWKGALWQPYIDSRIATLSALRDAGTEVALTWRTQRYFGILKKFDPGYRNANHAEYQVTVQITRPGNGAFTVGSGTSTDQQVAALNSGANVSAAAIAAADASAPSFQASLSNVALQLQAVGPIAQVSPSSLAPLSAALATALATATAYFAGLSPSSAAYVPAYSLVSQLKLMQTNVANGQVARVVPQQGGTLYETAVTQHGDVLRAFDLKDLNGLPSTVLSNASAQPIALLP